MGSLTLSILFLIGSALAVFTLLHWEELHNLRHAALHVLGSSPSKLAQGSAQAAIRRLAAILQSEEPSTPPGKQMADDVGIQVKHMQFHMAEKSLQAKAGEAESWLRTLQGESQGFRKRRRAASSTASALTRLGSFQAQHGLPHKAILGLQRAVNIMKTVIAEGESDSTTSIERTAKNDDDISKSTNDTDIVGVGDEKERELVITAKAEAALAEALCSAGGQKGLRQTEAKAIFGEAVQILKGVEHHGYLVDGGTKMLSAKVHASLAHCLHLNGDLATAEAMLRVAGVLTNETNASAGGTHMIPRLARLLGGVRHDEGSTEEAIRLYEEYLSAVPLHQGSAGEEHDEFMEAFETLQDHALASNSLGHSVQALQALHDVHVLQERLMKKYRNRTFLKDQGGPDLALLASTARTWQLRAMILLDDRTVEGEQNRLREAVGASAKAIPILKKLRDAGEGLRQLSDALNTHGNALNAVGRAAEAEAAYKQALDLSRELHGDNSPLTAAMLHNLGAAFAAQGKNSQALKLLNEALQILRQTLGDNPDVAAALASIAFIRRKQGDKRQALNLMHEAFDVAEKTLPADHTLRKQYKTTVELWEQQEINGREQANDVFET